MHIFIEKRKDRQTRWGLVCNRLAPCSLTPGSAGFGGESGPQEPIPTQKTPEGLFTRRLLTIDSADLRRERASPPWARATATATATPTSWPRFQTPRQQLPH